MHDTPSMTHLPDYVTPKKAGKGGLRAARPTWTASSLVQQHTFQKNENHANWAFDDLTYISTDEMYVNRCRLAHPVPSPRTKSPCGAQKGPIPATGALPQTQKGPGRGRDPLQRLCYALRQSPSYFTACLRAERTAASMALLVTVAPATPSMSALWAASTCWA